MEADVLYPPMEMVGPQYRQCYWYSDKGLRETALQALRENKQVQIGFCSCDPIVFLEAGPTAPTDIARQISNTYDRYAWRNL